MATQGEAVIQLESTNLPHFADKANTKGVIKFSQRDPFECFCSTTAGEERVSSKRAAED